MKVLDLRKKRKIKEKDFQGLTEKDIIIVDYKDIYLLDDKINCMIFVISKDENLGDYFYKWYKDALDFIENYANNIQDINEGFIKFFDTKFSTVEECIEYLNKFIEEVFLSLKE